MVDNGICPRKTIDKDNICQVNVIFQTNKPRAYICGSYFLRPQCWKPRILEDLTDIVIISPTFTS